MRFNVFNYLKNSRIIVLTGFNGIINFVTDGSRRQRILRYLLGMVLPGAIYFGLDVLTRGIEMLEFVPYAFLLFFVMALFPWLAIKLNLAQSDPLAREDSSQRLDPA